MKADRRVGKQKALQILAGEDESQRSNPQSYHTHFRRKMYPGKKRKFNPWGIEKDLRRRNWKKTHYHKTK